MMTQRFRNAWAANAMVVTMSLGCIGGDPGPELDGRSSGAAAAPRGGPSAPANVVTEIVPGRSGKPRFISVAPALAREGEPYTYGFAALDPDGEDLRYALVRAPEGASLAGDALEWIPRHNQAGRLQRFTLRAVDGLGEAQDQTWSVMPRAEDEHGSRSRHGHAHQGKSF